MQDLDDGKEFNGTEENMKKYPNNEGVACVFDEEDSIIYEGFALTAAGSLPLTVITELTKNFKMNRTR
jgi:hypothetical protein